ncbi:MAG: hypothetical protein AAGD25_05580 [Cyanobacteria bacterium P01_F01_bin.150]
MSSSQKSSKPQTPPLSRWKGRLRIFNKPTLWVSTSVLLFIGLLIADYSRVQMSQTDIDQRLELQNDGAENKEGDRQDASNVSDYGDTTQPATLDGIPLPDDPELREWAIREANNLNPDAEKDTQDGPISENRESADASERASTDALLVSDPTRLITHTENDNKSQEHAGSANANTRRNHHNRQDSQSESLFFEYVGRADDVLKVMGLGSSQASANSLATSLDSTTPSTEHTSAFWQSPEPDTSQPSALSQALQNLAIESSRQATDPSLSNNAASPNAYPDAPLRPSILPTSVLGQPLEGVPIFRQPLIQTSPTSGTTGYVAPPPLPNASPITSGNGVVPPTANGVTPNAILDSTAATSAPNIAPQPAVSVPLPQPAPAIPSPVFAAPIPVEQTPYTGGGRNGEINTFSNP